MKVSVCTGTYNRPKWLQETINSVLAQKGIELEYIICDNGSTSETAKVLDQYRADPRFVLCRNEENTLSGPPLSNLATGDFITYLPDDDLLLSEYSLLRRAAYLEDHPDCGFVFSSVRGHDADGKDVGLMKMGFVSSFDLPSQAATFDRLFIDCFIPYSSVMFRRSVNHLLGSEHILSCECANDWAGWVAIAKEHDQCYLTTPTVSLRTHEDQDTNVRGLKGGALIRAHLSVWRHWIKAGHNPSNADFGLMYKTLENLVIVSNLSIGDAQRTYKEFTELCDSNSPLRTPNICLCMIVKDEELSNEAHIIGRCLNSCKGIISSIAAICTTVNDSDAGGCRILIDDWGEENSIYTKAAYIIWRDDFSSARNMAFTRLPLLASRIAPEYLLLIDADEILNADPNDIYKALQDLSTNAWVIPTILPDGSVGTRVNLVRNLKGWQYVGAHHETLQLWGNNPEAVFLGNPDNPKAGPHVYTPGDGARSLDPDKLSKEIALMRRNQASWRDNFFLARLLEQRGDKASLNEAFDLFEKIPKVPGFRYSALLSLARIQNALRIPNWGRRFLEVYEENPSRVEALGELATEYARQENWALCRIYALACANAPTPTDMTFLEPEWARWRGLELLALSLVRLGQLKTAAQYLELLVRREGVPEVVVERAKSNLKILRGEK